MLTSPQKNRSSIAKDVVVPACLLFAIAATDHFLFSGITLAPLANFLAMGILAMYLRPIIMVFWACCYVLTSMIMLKYPEFSQHGPLNIVLTKDIRMIGAAAGGFVMIVFCITRAKIFNHRSELYTLFNLLPLPFVISDGNGSVVFISKEAEQLIGISREQASGQSYFTLLKISNQGSAIREYLSVLDLKVAHKSTTRFKLQNHQSKFCDGIMVPIDMDKGRCLITIFRP